MKPSIQTHRSRWLAIFGFLALGVLLLGTPSPLALQKDAPASWRVEIEEGKTARSTLTINNRCKALHQFRIENKTKIPALRTTDRGHSDWRGLNSTAWCSVRRQWTDGWRAS